MVFFLSILFFFFITTFLNPNFNSFSNSNSNYFPMSLLNLETDLLNDSKIHNTFHKFYVNNLLIINKFIINKKEKTKKLEVSRKKNQKERKLIVHQFYHLIILVHLFHSLKTFYSIYFFPPSFSYSKNISSLAKNFCFFDDYRTRNFKNSCSS
mgnify:CR=1 FL=1